MKKYTHNQIARTAARCVEKLFYCKIGALNFRGAADSPEITDAILFNSLASFTIEAKATVKDFNDEFSPSRKGRKQKCHNLGNIRFYACPADKDGKPIIDPDRIPARYSLIVVGKQKKCTVMYRVQTNKNDITNLKWVSVPAKDFCRTDFKISCPCWNTTDKEAEHKLLYYLAKRYKTREFISNLL